jgi:hypothetical protein
MKLRFWKRVYLSPFVRLNIIDGGLSISFGKRGLAWVTLSRRGIRWTAGTGIPGFSPDRATG